MSTAISIQLHDLTSAARAGKLGDVVERDAQISHLVRILMRPTHHHVVLVAEPGTGKTSLVEALALRLAIGKYLPLSATVYRLETEPLISLMGSGESLRECTQALAQAASRFDQAIIVVEDIQLLSSDDPGRLELTLQLLQALANRPGIRLITTTTESAYRRTFATDYLFNRLFYALELTPPTIPQATLMVEQAAPALERTNHQHIDHEAIDQAVIFGSRFGHGRALPDAAIRLLEETCVKVSLESNDTVTARDIKAVVAERERLPLQDLDIARNDTYADLGSQLDALVVGQTPATRTIARQLAKAALGLGDARRPRGSFLLLGPSGVGKTETARALAKLVYSGPKALVRLDMSEYAESHAAIRLIGSPPGYVGYEEGGQLTGAVAREPYSLVLLDEIEKAHPKLFDLFLQLLDDGRLTDSAGHTVDFTETLVLATSNTGSREISQAAADGVDITTPAFLHNTLIPLLLRTYRPEFINRFDAILVYQPLSSTHLVSLAQRELASLSARLRTLGVTFNVSDQLLSQLLAPHTSPLFGARPVRRVISDHFETPIADLLIRGALTGPLEITGQEPWLMSGVQV